MAGTEHSHDTYDTLPPLLPRLGNSAKYIVHFRYSYFADFILLEN